MEVSLFYGGIVLAFVICFESLPSHFRGMARYTLWNDRFSGPLIMALLLLAGFAGFFEHEFRGVENFHGFGLVLVIAGFLLRVAARYCLGKDFTYTIVAVRKICARGIYGYIRHPAYFGTILYAVGIAYLFGSSIGFIFALLTIALVFYRVNIEEKFLCKHVAAYGVYMNHTCRFIPFVY